MSTSRDDAAHALLELVGKGPGVTFPFPQQKFEAALTVIDQIAEHLSERSSKK